MNLFSKEKDLSSDKCSNEARANTKSTKLSTPPFFHSIFLDVCLVVTVVIALQQVGQRISESNYLIICVLKYEKLAYTYSTKVFSAQAPTIPSVYKDRTCLDDLS